MSRVTRDGETFVVDAGLLSDAFGLDEEQVRQGMREGRITSRSERGEDEDAVLALGHQLADGPLRA